ARPDTVLMAEAMDPREDLMAATGLMADMSAHEFACAPPITEARTAHPMEARTAVPMAAPTAAMGVRTAVPTEATAPRTADPMEAPTAVLMGDTDRTAAM